MTHSKQNLPTKICPVCHRSFTWRKKWARDWDTVRYCSDRCRKIRSVSDAEGDSHRRDR